MKIVGGLLELLSGEFILTRCRRPNGGTVVLVRAFIISVAVFFAGLVVMNVIDPRRGGSFSSIEFRMQIIEHAKWWGALYGSAYAALYARFASQWSYLAGVYNQLKAAQMRSDSDQGALAEWRAGFIEDCDELHLLRKPMFASIVNALLSDDTPNVTEIRSAFDGHTPGGVARRRRIEREVAAVVSGIELRYS
jgi:hypothetical protein